MDHRRRRYPQYALPLAFAFDGLSCVFCKNVLSRLDELRCRQKRFNRIHKNGQYYGACSSCLENALTIERSLFPTSLVLPAALEVTSGRPWNKLIVRCYYCGSPLSKDEKYRHILDSEPFVRARGTFKGRCNNCRSDGSRPVHGQASSGSRA